ncbi:FAD-dependent oxidoreductase [Diaminobutyricibacter sp. McL0618]|uniref:FAD-dependent oxidoreductase n=1 Tax=Leifsonia sp. McL0618 TaxID=3415677 RepID=UPI003CE9EF91
MEKTDVAIVGAGPVGLTLALALGRAGVNVVVVERDAEINLSPRAMVYLHPLLPDLDRLGLVAGMLKRGFRDDEGLNLHLASTGEVISIPNTALDGIDPFPFNIHLGQGEYCSLVAELLADLDNVDVRSNSEVVTIDDQEATATVHLQVKGVSQALEARYVVGADGGHSVVRASIGASLEGTTWGERFVATNVRFDFRSRGFKSSNMYIDPEIGCIIAQITPDGLWRCTYQESLELPESTVADRIPQHFDRLLGADASVELVDFRPYRMHQRLSSSLRSGHVVLAGDAAHLTNPTGGLGLTTGLYDVLLLEEVLLAVLRGEAGDELLDRYAEERSRVFSHVSSPNATYFKTLVYDTTDPAVVDAQVQPFRDAAKTLEGQRAFLSGLDMVRSPSLTGAHS